MKTLIQFTISLALLSGTIAGHAQVAKAITGLMTKKTSDFSEMSITFAYNTNIYSPEWKTLTSKFVKEGWEEGSSMVGIVITKVDGIGLLKLDGTVTIDGEELPFVGAGSYIKFYKNDDLKPKEIKLTTVDGKSFSYSVSPVSSVTIKSVNGQTDNVSLDLEQDLKLEMDVPADVQNDMLSLAMIVGVPGGKDFSNFLIAKPANSLNVPQPALASKQVSGGGLSKGSNVIDYKKDNLLRAEIYREKILDGTPFGAARYLGTGWAFKPVRLEGKDKGVNYIFIDGTTDKEQGKMDYLAQKPSSFYAPSIRNLKTIGIASLNVSGTLYKKTSTESSHTTGNVRYTTVTTTTWQFPQLPDEYWNQFLENMHADITSMLKETYGMQIIETDKITAEPEYNEFFVPKDENTEIKVEKSYRDTRRLIPTTLGETIELASTTYSQDRHEVKLMNKVGADALLLISIDLRVNDDGKKKIVLDPVLTYKVIGNQVNYGLGAPPVILEGTIIGKGVPFAKSDFNDINALNTIAQKDFLLNAFMESIKAIEAEADNHQYYETWKLQMD